MAIKNKTNNYQLEEDHLRHMCLIKNTPSGIQNECLRVNQKQIKKENQTTQ